MLKCAPGIWWKREFYIIEKSLTDFEKKIILCWKRGVLPRVTLMQVCEMTCNIKKIYSIIYIVIFWLSNVWIGNVLRWQMPGSHLHYIESYCIITLRFKKYYHRYIFQMFDVLYTIFCRFCIFCIQKLEYIICIYHSTEYVLFLYICTVIYIHIYD